jgi:hypothetical protein
VAAAVRMHHLLLEALAVLAVAVIHMEEHMVQELLGKETEEALQALLELG